MENITFSKYPLKSLLIYYLATILHYLFGYFGILIAFDYSSAGKIVSAAYLCFAIVQMYILMPMMVCPNCAYTNKPEMLCISGLNVIARKFFPKGDLNNFKSRSEGILCHNNLYMSAKILPVLIILPFLFINFSWALLLLLISVIGLLLLRIFYIFKKIACNHCLVRNICPNAISMGIGE